VLLSSIFFASGTEFDNLDQLTSESLSDAQRKSILDNKKLILSFLNAVEAQAKYTLEVGGYVEGYKLVEGSPRATWTLILTFVIFIFLFCLFVIKINRLNRQKCS
jgi:hypothetical protein